MNLGQIKAFCIGQARKYNIELDQDEIKEVLNSSLATIHSELGFPKAIWETGSDKPSSALIIDYPDDCIQIDRLFLDGVESYLLPLDEMERQFRS